MKTKIMEKPYPPSAPASEVAHAPGSRIRPEAADTARLNWLFSLRDDSASRDQIEWLLMHTATPDEARRAIDRMMAEGASTPPDPGAPTASFSPTGAP